MTHIKEQDMKLKRLFLVVSVTFWGFDILGVDTLWDSDILELTIWELTYWHLTYFRVDIIVTALIPISSFLSTLVYGIYIYIYIGPL